MTDVRRFLLPVTSLSFLVACSAASVDDPAGSGGANGEMQFAPIDGNGDGVADTLGVSLGQGDFNNDGILDTLIDTNWDGIADGIGIDTDGDGILDGLDSNGDGIVDVVAPPPPPIGSGGTGSGGTDGGVGAGGNVGPGTGGTASNTGGGGGVTPPSGTWNAPVVSAAASAAASEYASWHGKYFKDCNDGTACIEDVGNGRCVSEGIGYGMLAAVSADDQPTFDKLWAFYKKHKNANGVMNWEINTCGTVRGQNGAADAELDAAYGLIQANARWGGTTYGTDATTLITAIKTHETEICSGRIILRPGDAWGGCSDSGTDKQVNPSYFAPAYYRAFAVHVPSQAADWNKMVTDTYDLFDMYQARMNGLIPDWGYADGAAVGWAEKYGYESVRAPWRIAIDYGLTGDARAKAVLEKLAAYTKANGNPAGVPFDNNSAFRGSLATSGLTDQATADTFYSSWIGKTDMDDAPYYQGTLRILFVQAMGGEFYVP